VAIKYREDLVDKRLTGIPRYAVAAAVAERRKFENLPRIAEDAEVNQVLAAAVQMQHHDRWAFTRYPICQAVPVEVDRQRFAHRRIVCGIVLAPNNMRCRRGSDRQVASPSPS
jgi:hypothetical protein